MSWLFLLPLLIFAGAFAAFELGAQSSRRHSDTAGTSSPHNGAIYALLGLLVADRQDAVLYELLITITRSPISPP